MESITASTRPVSFFILFPASLIVSNNITASKKMFVIVFSLLFCGDMLSQKVDSLIFSVRELHVFVNWMFKAVNYDYFTQEFLLQVKLHLLKLKVVSTLLRLLYTNKGLFIVSLQESCPE